LGLGTFHRNSSDSPKLAPGTVRHLGDQTLEMPGVTGYDDCVDFLAKKSDYLVGCSRQDLLANLNDLMTAAAKEINRRLGDILINEKSQPNPPSLA
jgi:hypothetical protein